MRDHKLPAVTQQFFFQRRNERLDWRKIASLDLHKILLDGDAISLQEFISPILFCRPDSEFDLDKTDPGFIKVFTLSQLIGEVILSLYEQGQEEVTQLAAKCVELECQKKKLEDELATAKENLLGSKRELKKTKDMLACTQSQVLGADNQDEIDQCPYCNKRFLSLFYLHAHIQRRHQGLPLSPLILQQQQQQQLHPHLYQTAFSSPVQAPVYAVTANPNATPTTPSRAPIISATGAVLPTGAAASNCGGVVMDEIQGGVRTESGTSYLTGESRPSESEGEFIAGERYTATKLSPALGESHQIEVLRSPDKNSAGIVSTTDLPMICDLVEQYLEQKSIAGQNQHYDKILKSIYNGSLSNVEFRCLSSSSAGDGNGRESNPLQVVPVPLQPRESEIERIEKNVMQMKDDFEEQWRKLSEKVSSCGIEELRAGFLTEIKKVQELILQNAAPKIEQLNFHSQTSPESSSNVKTSDTDTNHKSIPLEQEKISEGMEKAVLRLEGKLDLDKKFQRLSQNLEEKMEEMRENMGAQEELWLKKIYTMEQEHEKQIEKLKKEFEEKIKVVEAETITKMTVAKLSSQMRGELTGTERIQMKSPTETKDTEVEPIPKPRSVSVGAGTVLMVKNANDFGVNSTDISSPTRESERDGIGWNDSISITGKKQQQQQNQSTQIQKQKQEAPELNLSQHEHELPEYLTIIHDEGDSSLVFPSSPLGMEKGQKIRTMGRSITTITNTPLLGLSLQNHEYEEPLRYNATVTEISDYTLSSSVQSSCNSNEEDERQEERRKSPSTRYVFDPVQGKIIDAKETKSQLDLIRDKVVLDELDEQLTGLGLDPKTNTIGLGEMAMALKNLKVEKRRENRKDGELYESHLHNLRRNVKYETTKSVIQQKIKEFETSPSATSTAAASSQKKTPTTALTNIMSKVRQSGSTFRQKVASAMKRKRALKKNDSGDDAKTTFFAKWGRKKKENKEQSLERKEKEEPAAIEETASNSEEYDSDSEEQQQKDSSDESESLLEMPPFMKRASPIHSHSPRKRGGGGGGRRRRRKFSSDSAMDSDGVYKHNGPPATVKYRKPQPKPRTVPMRNLSTAAQSPDSNEKARQQPREMESQLMTELKGKLAQRQQKFSYKGPNFFADKVSSPPPPPVSASAKGSILYTNVLEEKDVIANARESILSPSKSTPLKLQRKKRFVKVPSQFRSDHGGWGAGDNASNSSASNKQGHNGDDIGESWRSNKNYISKEQAQRKLPLSPTRVTRGSVLGDMEESDTSEWGTESEVEIFEDKVEEQTHGYGKLKFTNPITATLHWDVNGKKSYKEVKSGNSAQPTPTTKVEVTTKVDVEGRGKAALGKSPPNSWDSD